MKSNYKTRFIQLATLFLCILTFSNCWGLNLTVHDFDKIGELTSNADGHDLIIYDVDDVLVQSQDKILQGSNRKFRDKAAAETNQQKMTLGEKHWDAVLRKTQFQLVDHQAPRVIKQQQANGAKVIALTHFWYGRFGNFATIHQNRSDMLKNKGYDLSRAFHTRNTLSFQKIKNPKHKWSPGYHQGILFTSGVDKGVTLKHFLKQIDFKPRRIVFVDDKQQNLDAVEQFCRGEGIQYLGILFKPFNQAGKVDNAVAQLQFKTLTEDGIWLTDQEADLMLAKEIMASTIFSTT